MEFSTFEEKLAYEIGYLQAQQAYLEKVGSWGDAVRGGISFLKGKGFTHGAGQSFTQTANKLFDPFRNAYKTYGARMEASNLKNQSKNIRDEKSAIRSLTGKVPEDELLKRQDNLTRMLAENKASRDAFKNSGGFQTAKNPYIQEGQGLDMAITGGVGALGTYGAYNLAGNALGFSNYEPGPQLAPHQYYMNKYFG